MIARMLFERGVCDVKFLLTLRFGDTVSKKASFVVN